MINIKQVKKYCSENINLIENYRLAINDDQMWHCHHKKETDEGLSVKQLKELCIYYDRPASELIFLTHHEHISAHQSGRHLSEETRQKLSVANMGVNNAMYGKHHSEETKQKIGAGNRGKIISEETKQKMRKPKSEEHKQKIGAGNRGKIISEETKQKMSAARKGKHRVYHKDGTFHLEK